MIRYALLMATPLSLGLRYALDAPALWVFLASAVAVAILAEWIRRATGQLAQHAGPSIGGLLTVSFGSIAELVLALFVLTLFVLARGQTEVVQAQIAGSILGTSLFGLGPACFRRC